MFIYNVTELIQIRNSFDSVNLYFEIDEQQKKSPLRELNRLVNLKSIWLILIIS